MYVRRAVTNGAFMKLCVYLELKPNKVRQALSCRLDEV